MSERNETRFHPIIMSSCPLTKQIDSQLSMFESPTSTLSETQNQFESDYRLKRKSIKNIDSYQLLEPSVDQKCASINKTRPASAETELKFRQCEYLKTKNSSNGLANEKNGYEMIKFMDIKQCCVSPKENGSRFSNGKIDEARFWKQTIVVENEDCDVENGDVEFAVNSCETNNEKNQDVCCDETGLKTDDGVDCDPTRKDFNIPNCCETNLVQGVVAIDDSVRNNHDCKEINNNTSANCETTRTAEWNENGLNDDNCENLCSMLNEKAQLKSSDHNCERKGTENGIDKNENVVDDCENHYGMKEKCTNEVCGDRNEQLATKGSLGLSRSLCNKPQINDLKDLIQELHLIFAHDLVNVDYVEFVMKSYKSNFQEWKKYAKFDKYKYTRNLVDAGNDKFNLMILCWGEGHGSSVHDHANAHCFMKMLDGALTETRYAWPSNAQVHEEEQQPLQVISKSQLNVNEVCYINDSLGLHRVENSSYSNRAVSLHLYSPPFNACSVFNEKTGHKSISKVTFWSKFGKRNKTILTADDRMTQVLEDN